MKTAEGHSAAIDKGKHVYYNYSGFRGLENSVQCMSELGFLGMAELTTLLEELHLMPSAHLSTRHFKGETIASPLLSVGLSMRTTNPHRLYSKALESSLVALVPDCWLDDSGLA